VNYFNLMILASSYDYDRDNDGALCFIGCLIIAIFTFYLSFISILSIRKGMKCSMCGKKIELFDPSRIRLDSHVFCGLICRLKYANEIADIEDRLKSAGKSKNYNINDRNKFLK